MLIVKFSNLDIKSTVYLYKDNIIEIDIQLFDKNPDVIIDVINQIKIKMQEYEIVIINYHKEIVECLNALNITYILMYPDNLSSENSLFNKEEVQFFINNQKEKLIINNNEEFESYLKAKYDWKSFNNNNEESIDKDINIVKNEIMHSSIQEEPIQEEPIQEIESENIEENLGEKESTDNKIESIKIDSSDNENNKPIESNSTNHFNNLTMQDLLKEDTIISETDVRNLKVVENKLKIGMILQAKTSLNRILKLSTVLDKLYDELIDRIDTDLSNTDTASLMYTADYISKALNDNNQFILNLINNDKIKNFFIIDNSNIINVSDNSIDISKRDRIRRAVEIVLDNIDKFETGNLNDLKDPNIIEGDVIDNGYKQS